VTEPSPSFPVPVKDHPHFRICIRPEIFKPDLIPTLRDCFEIIERTKVSLRGWDYPHVSHETQEKGYGNNWVASWSSFCSLEYWRFFQSGQFVHYLGIREKIDSDWETELRSTLKRHLSYMKNLDFSKISGLFSVSGAVYTITEIFEFAIRLCQKGLYSNNLVIEIALNNVQGFALVADRNRAWHHLYQASEPSFSKEWKIPVSELIASGHDFSIEVVIWLFERFGWFDPPREILKKDQEKFLSGQY